MPLAVQINKENGIPIYVQLGEQIRLLIHQGRLQAGDLMPTVRQLAVELELNSNTVARVYRDLQHEGLLVLKRGIGTYVSNKVQMKPLSAKDRALLDRQVDALIATACRLRMRPPEIFQLIETRWQEN